MQVSVNNQPKFAVVQQTLMDTNMAAQHQLPPSNKFPL